VLWSWPVDPRVTTVLHRLVLETLPRSDATLSAQPLPTSSTGTVTRC